MLINNDWISLAIIIIGCLLIYFGLHLALFAFLVWKEGTENFDHNKYPNRRWIIPRFED